MRTIRSRDFNVIFIKIWNLNLSKRKSNYRFVYNHKHKYNLWRKSKLEIYHIFYSRLFLIFFFRKLRGDYLVPVRCCGCTNALYRFTNNRGDKLYLKNKKNRPRPVRYKVTLTIDILSLSLFRRLYYSFGGRTEINSLNTRTGLKKKKKNVFEGKKKLKKNILNWWIRVGFSGRATAAAHIVRASRSV